MDIIVCTTARNDDEARALLDGFHFPFSSELSNGDSNAETEES